MTHGLINRFAASLDFIAIVIGAVSIDLAGSRLGPLVTVGQAFIAGLITATVFVALMRNMHAYRVEHYTSSYTFFPPLIVSYAGAVVAGGAVLRVFLPQLFPGHHHVLAIWAILVLLLLLFERLCLLLLARYVLFGGHLRTRVAVIGATEDAAALLRQLNEPALRHQYSIIGVFDNRTAERHSPAVAKMGVMGSVPDLIAYAQQHPVDMVVIALPWENAVAIFRLIEQVQWIAADVVVPFETQGFQPGSGQLIDLAGHPAMQVMTRPFKGTLGLLKTTEDLLIATIGLLLASPVMAIAALAILIEDGRPIMFRQARMGFNGRPFKIYKFRTMQLDPTDDGSRGTDKGDPRITRVGRFLRSSSIDEIPQLLNVLTGDMSIVGPRPHVPGMVVGSATYTEAVRRYAARHRIKPGITGWAQINGMRGGIHTLTKAERGVALDLYYLRHWSIWLDIKIMLRTLLIGMAGRDVF